ncbi:MAG: ParB/RepB/Spo0J family partition protein [Burkholderiaceae bacterium]|jgi:ParB family chromosome partitioning protein
MIKRKGLGRGLEALLGESPSAAVPVTDAGVPTHLPLTFLQRGKYQPRTRMDEGALSELAASIRVHGLMQPILVRCLAENRYEVIAGERRLRAAALAGLSEVPVVVRDVPDESAAVMALIENIQREDLNPLEEAHGVQRLLDEFGLTHEQAAEAIGRSRSATSNLLRLLNLAKPVQTMLMAGDLDMGHARALLAVDSAHQINLANQVVGKRLSVRDTERLVARLEKESSAPRNGLPPTKSRDLARLEEELSDALATKVTIAQKARGRGQIIIDFAGLDQLDGLLVRLRERADTTSGK